ncbi:LacI family DNA-binding transcriptional regulator [Amorphus coralli]|uniref:LacI family DNA-binding transcriptional regulator n=1 Tax=Amorphus coralli TaxID=340680 RepID=UPI0003779A9E|nr:LacI family DNA-binding transcriptional regulator [Amorphus coralli]
MPTQPKLEDVARLSGVSTATVSRVFNAPTLVREETRKRVEAAVASLGYTPHFGGRALASNRTWTVGAVIPTMENAIFARGLQAMEETLAEAGVTLLVSTSNYDCDREAAQIAALIGRGVDGLILIGESREDATYELLERRGTPYVLVWSWRADSPRPCVGFDNRAAAAAIAERVVELGHRRIAMIAGITDHNDRAAARVDGARDALTAHGLALEPPYLVEAKYSVDAGAKAARALMALDPRPTAILCGNDVLATGALMGVREAGLSVPRDVSVTGFDDIELARVVDPPLTTVHVPHRRMGAQAAEALLAQCAGAPGPVNIAMEADIIERGSLAPPPT